jgi:hypothetical protein
MDCAECYDFCMFQYLLAPLIAAILTTVLNTYTTAYFSFSRFRREQWWQAKREAYESIIRTLAQIMFRSERYIAEVETGGEVVPPQAPEREKELSWSLQEIASSGAYIVSEKTVEEAGKVIQAMSMPNAPELYPYVVRERDAAKHALEVIRAEAHRELRVELDGRWRRSRFVKGES